jgi:hypothetical protein
VHYTPFIMWFLRLASILTLLRLVGSMIASVARCEHTNDVATRKNSRYPPQSTTKIPDTHIYYFTFWRHTGSRISVHHVRYTAGVAVLQKTNITSMQEPPQVKICANTLCQKSRHSFELPRCQTAHAHNPRSMHVYLHSRPRRIRRSRRSCSECDSSIHRILKKRVTSIRQEPRRKRT